MAGNKIGEAGSIVSAAVASACPGGSHADARPSRIILLRHAEKATSSKLSEIGRRRAEALAKQYLGKDAIVSLFSAGQAPAAFFSVTPHSLETITPAAQTWGLPVVFYSLAIDENDSQSDDAKEELLARRTQAAAHDVLTKPELAGKIVVISWEHKHIANSKLAPDTTFRQLLGLAGLEGVPETWPGGNYDYFWIVDYAPGKSTPSNFKMIRQAFAEPYDDLPTNKWGNDEPPS